MPSVDPAVAGVSRPGLDPDSAQWVRALSGAGPQREAALERLHGLLLGIAQAEARRRGGRLGIAGPELDDLAYQAAADALLAITAKVSQFRGESRFTTWAYAFVMFEVSAKTARHSFRNAAVLIDAEDWDRLPDRISPGLAAAAEHRDLAGAVRRAVDTELTPRQRQVFVAVVLACVSLDALAAELGTTRGALYKTMFDARRKLRAALAAQGYLPGDPARRRLLPGRRRGASRMSDSAAALDRFLHTDPRDVGCAEAMALLHVYAELVAADAGAADRYPGITAHLRACGPCSEDFDGLLATLAAPAG